MYIRECDSYEGGEGFVFKKNGLVVDNMTDFLFFAHTSGGRKFVLVESVESWLEFCARSICHLHLTWQVWDGQIITRF